MMQKKVLECSEFFQAYRTLSLSYLMLCIARLFTKIYIETNAEAIKCFYDFNFLWILWNCVLLNLHYHIVKKNLTSINYKQTQGIKSFTVIVKDFAIKQINM